MFIFKKLRDLENPFDVSEVEMKVESASLTEILEEFKFFLMSSGFHITGDIEIIEDEPEYSTEEL